MNAYALRLKKEAAFRDYINHWRADVGQDSDVEWWTDSHATKELSRLTDTVQWAASDSQELSIEDDGNLVVAVWNGGTDKQGLLLLLDDMMDRLQKVVEARNPAYDQALEQATCESKIFIEKMETNFLVFTRDVKSRIAVEMQFAALTKGWKRDIYKKYAVPITIGTTYIVYPEYQGKLARIRGINRYNSLQMEPIGGRSNAESQCEFVEDIIQSTVMTVQLKQLAELYNQVGDQLFRYNVRFGIDEALDVSKAIQKTLKEEPQRFWYKNNGITLLVENPDFRLEHLDELQLGTLEAGRPPLFSVVNGAQTITISARYAFELECKKQEDEEYKKQLEDFEKAQVILRVIHIPIQSEQDATNTERDKIQEAKNLAHDISVSLNRQKPVKAEDIAFTSPFVQKMEEYLSNPQNNPPFQLVRRGEERAQGSQLGLVDFSKARLACKNRPDKARTTSSSEILKMDIVSGTLQNTDIFVENWIISEDDEKEIFQRFYGAVWFADQMATIYAKNAKTPMDESINTQIAVQNGKWYFTALVVQLLNNFKSMDGQPDFSEFHWFAQDFVEIIPQAVKAFSQMAAYCADHERQLTSNDFKSESYYQKLLTELKSDKKAAPFKEFSKLFVPANGDKPSPQQKLKQQKITAIALGGINNHTPVKSAKDAFEKTIAYILENFTPESALLAQYDSWLTTDPQKITSPKGNFNSKSSSILYRGKTYWIGSEALSNDNKFACVNSLCNLAHVPHGEISWLADGTVRYQW